MQVKWILIILLFTLFSGIVVGSGITEEQANNLIFLAEMFIIFIAAVVIFVGGVLAATYLIKLGSTISITSNNNNDQWDAQKTRALVEVFKAGAEASKNYLSETGPAMTFDGNLILPPVEGFHQHDNLMTTKQ